jgi:hypothetical protein
MVTSMERNLDTIVKAIYEDVRAEIDEMTALEEKRDAIVEGRELLESLSQYPEHSAHPKLLKALSILEDHEMRMVRTIALRCESEEEERLVQLKKTITFTASDKQVLYLLNLGAKPEHLAGITKVQASAMITALKNG